MSICKPPSKNFICICLTGHRKIIMLKWFVKFFKIHCSLTLIFNVIFKTFYQFFIFHFLFAELLKKFILTNLKLFLIQSPFYTFIYFVLQFFLVSMLLL